MNKIKNIPYLPLSMRGPYEDGRAIHKAWTVLDLAWNTLRSKPRSKTYPLLGIILALATSFGLLFARAFAAKQLPSFAWIVADIGYVSATYAYVAVSSISVFSILGYLLGRWFDRVRLLSVTDPLTGLFNRRYLEQRFEAEMERGRRHGGTTCILYVDIDRLKAINDSFGHKTGDRAIVTVSQTLVKSVRVIDTVARIGGDEFTVLLPATSLDKARGLSQRILTEFSRSSTKKCHKLSVSIGVAELQPTTDLKFSDFLATADVALYRAKTEGGGRMVSTMAKKGDLHGKQRITFTATSPSAQKQTQKSLGGQS